MSLIDQKVIEKFSTWAERNEDKQVFPEISMTENSYYMTRKSEKTYMMEYSFKTVPELKRLLEEHCGLQLDPDMLKILMIEIYQNRFKNELKTHDAEHRNSTGKAAKEETGLPEFIYIF